MKKLFIIANWKSNKTVAEAKEWLTEISNFTLSGTGKFEISNEKEVIVCPSFTALALVTEYSQQKALPLKIGSQNISPFEEGAYTGEVNAKQIAEFVHYTIIGHSERRAHFFEDEAMLAKKVSQALANNLTPIFCVQSAETSVPQGVTMVAYEPVFAIGSGHPDTPESADHVAGQIKEKYKVPFVLYGGSVTEDNVHSFTTMEHIDGVLVGGASLDAEKFIGIIKNA
jgi:triosephosphate isomerase